MAELYSPTDTFLGKLPEGQREKSLKDLQAYLSVEYIELANSEESGADHFLGTATLLNVPCQVESLIGTDDSFLLLCAQPQNTNGEDWNFGRAFPAMPGDWVPEDQLDEPDVFFLRFLKLDNPLWLYVGLSNGTPKATLVAAIQQLELFNSWPQAGKDGLLEELELEQNSGLYLWGNISQPPAAMGDLFSLLNGSATEQLFKQAIVKGSVVIPSETIFYPGNGDQDALYAPGFPVLTLRVSLGSTDFGSSSVQLNGTLELSSPLYFSPKSSVISLEGGLALPVLDQNLNVRINFPVSDDTITVSGTYTAGLPFIDGSTLPGVEEGHDGQAELNSQVLLEFSKSTKGLTRMAFGASMENLVFFEEKLTIDHLGLFFQIYDPLGIRVVSASMQATALLGKNKSLAMALGGSYPDGRLFLQMQSASLRQVVTDLGITDDVDEIPDLNVRVFNVEYHYTRHFFAAQLLVDGQWAVADWLVFQDLRFGITGTSGELDLGFSTGFELAGTPMKISAAFASRPETTSWQFSAGLEQGATIEIGKLIEDLATKFSQIHLPPSLAGLTIHDLLISFDTDAGGSHFFFTMSLLFPIDEKELDLILVLEIEKKGSQFIKRFSGTILIADLIFNVIINQSGIDTSFHATFDSSDGLKLNPLDLLNELSPSETFSFGSDSDAMGVFTIYHLGFVYESTAGATPEKRYTFTGKADWAIGLPLMDTGANITIDAEVKFIKSSKTSGLLDGSYIKGSLETSGDDFLQALRLGTAYRFGANPSLSFEAEIGGIILLLDYKEENNEKIITISSGASAESKELSFGSLISFMVGLVDPSVDDFQLDPPWDALDQIVLSGFAFEINITTKEVAVKYNRSIDIGFMTIDALGISYVRTTSGSPPKTKGQVNLELEGTFLGVSKKMDWDPLNDAPPEVPGQGAAIFDLRYLGIGQHVAFTQAANVSSIKEVMDLLRGVIDENQRLVSADRSLKLRNPLEMFGDGSVISFSPESEWLVGLDVTLLKTLSLSVIFNDPAIYGLRIELYGKLAKNFAGLQFEILYQKISPTIGKYHVDLTLPDFVRHLQFGAVSVTLPIIVVDIFTNGDFKVDLGFPWNFSFARSFAIEVFPFTGAGGFYFNKLSAATATSTPVIPASRGVFTPVYEFGLGLRIGLGKTFNKGPLKAEISIVVEGIVEGVISWFNPADGSERSLYYKIGGGVAIVGRLYGEVDFGIISVSVEVIARAMIQFLLEVYQPILIDLTAEVSVKASVKVAFVKVSFSFSLTVKQSFTIPSPQKETAPWLT